MDSDILKKIANIASERFENIGEYKDLLYYNELEDGTDMDLLDSSIYHKIAEAVGASCVFHGKTKLVFGFADMPEYVFKIPMYGVKYYESLYDDENDDIDFIYVEQENYACADEFIDELTDDAIDIYEWSNVSVSENDYCAAEAAIYSIACEYGIEKFFAGTWFVTDVDGVSIYVSERIPDKYRKTATVPNGSYERIKNDDNFKELFELQLECDVVYQMISKYTYSAAIKLADFLIANAIGDLHDDNIGTRANGDVVIVDYSGFRD